MVEKGADVWKSDLDAEKDFMTGITTAITGPGESFEDPEEETPAPGEPSAQEEEFSGTRQQPTGR